MSERWFEDYAVGTTGEYGPIRVTEDDVVDVGRRGVDLVDGAGTVVLSMVAMNLVRTRPAV